VVQLTMARLLDWLTVTLPGPEEMVADPPTTVPPSGSASADDEARASSAVEVSKKLWKRAIAVPLEASGHDEEETPVVARSVDRLGGRQIGGKPPKGRENRLPTEADSSPDRRTIHAPRCSQNRGKIMEPAPVGIRRGLGALGGPEGEVLPERGQELDALVAEKWRGVERAPEVAAAIAALFGRQERVAGILAIGGDQER